MVEFGFNVPRCPRCLSLDIKPSKHTWRDFLLLITLLKASRCGTCGFRFGTWLRLPKKT